MQLVFLTPEYTTSDRIEGGLANYVAKTARLLASRNRSVSVISISDQTRSFIESSINIYLVKRIRFFSRLPQFVPFYSYLVLLDHLLTLFRLTRKFYFLNQQQHFSVIQTSSYMFPGLILTLNKKLPLICRVSSLNSELRKIYTSHTTLIDKIYDHLEYLQIKKAKTSFAPSRLLVSLCAQHQLSEVKLIRTPVVEMSLNYPARTTQLKNYFLYCGTLNLVKGIDILLDILPQFLPLHQNINFIIIGRNDGNYFSKIDKLSQRYPGRIIYSPPLPHDRLFPIIKNALALLAPSRIDNYPNICLEALQLGTPVIAADHSSIEEIITQGKTGFLFTNSSSAAFISTLEQFIRLTIIQKTQMQKACQLSAHRLISDHPEKLLLNLYHKATYAKV